MFTLKILKKSWNRWLLRSSGARFRTSSKTTPHPVNFFNSTRVYFGFTIKHAGHIGHLAQPGHLPQILHFTIFWHGHPAHLGHFAS